MWEGKRPSGTNKKDIMQKYNMVEQINSIGQINTISRDVDDSRRSQTRCTEDIRMRITMPLSTLTPTTQTTQKVELNHSEKSDDTNTDLPADTESDMDIDPEAGDNNNENENNIDFFSFIENSPIPMFAVDQKGILNAWNAKCSELTGFSRHEALTKKRSFESFITNKMERTKVSELIHGSVSGTESTVKVVFFTKKGKELHLSLTSTALRSSRDKNKICGTVVFFYEEIEATKQDLVQKRFNKFMDTVPAPVFGVDLDGNINLCNEKAVKLSGCHSNNTIYKTPFMQSLNVAPRQRMSFQEILDNAFSGVDTSAYELEYTTKSNEIRYLVTNVGTRRDVNNNNIIVGALIVVQDVTKVTQHQKAITNMVQGLRHHIGKANAPIFGIDRRGHVNEWNDKIVEITRISADEAFKKLMRLLLVTPKCLQDALSRALQAGGTPSYEAKTKTKSHEKRYLSTNVTAQRDSENRLLSAFAFPQDNTEESKHKRDADSMASELRRLIDMTNARIFDIVCDSGNTNEWNNEMADVAEFANEEAFGSLLLKSFIAAQTRDPVRDVSNNALEGQKTSNYGSEFPTKSNEVQHLVMTATTRRDSENNEKGILSAAQDATEDVQAMERMALELRQLIHTANAPIFGIDSDGNVNEWNPRTEAITGYSKEEAINEPFVEKFIAPSMQARVGEILGAALKGKESSNYELEFVSKMGEAKVVLVNAMTRRDPDYNAVGVVGVAQDVTENRKNAEALRKIRCLKASQESKLETERNMTAYFSHELRNPLGAIICALNAMPDDLPESAKSLVHGMQLCSSFMSSIMNDLLDVRKMEEGKMTLHNAPMSLNNVLSVVHKMLLSSIRPSVNFVKVCNSAVRGDWVLGDKHRIQQVMTNVVTNAIKYTVKGSVTILIGWEGENMRFECVDTGPGIPKREQKKLFERFTKRGGAPGTGLGLAIAKHLVDLTGGSIQFHSDPSVRAGTSCVVLMPLPLCGPPSDELDQVEDAAPIEQPVRFLIIDDVKMNRMMLRRRIVKGIAPKAVITEAATGEEALEICGTETFDVIVVDQYMEEAGGVMVGTDVVFAMRRMRVGSTIIGCSGNNMVTAFQEAGADLVWQKPMPTNAQIIKDLRHSLSKQGRLI